MDNNLTQMMMQMLMQNQQMMNMIMAQAMQNPSTPMMSTVAQNNETASAEPSDSVNAQIADLQHQIESLKLELAAEKQTREAVEKSYQSLQEERKKDLVELSDLKKTVRQAEAYLGQKIEDVAAHGEVLSGDDYYDEKKEEWDDKGLSNQEKHDMVKKFKSAFIPEEGKDDLFQF